MNDLIIKDMLKDVKGDKDLFNDEAVQYITDRINAMLDIPFINEDVERIIFNAIIKIIFNLLISRSSVLLKS